MTTPATAWPLVRGRARAVVLLSACVAAAPLLGACRKKPPAVTPAHLAVGREHACVAMQSGALYCWGAGDRAQLGDAKSVPGRSVALPVRAEAAEALAPTSASLHAGGPRTCSISPAGKLACWGGERVPSEATEGVVDVAVAEHHACIVGGGGRVVCWGTSARGGLGGEAPSPAGLVVVPVGPAHAVAVARERSCALLNDGSVACWGDNTAGALGDGTTEDRPRPVRVALLRGITQLALGGGHACAVDADGHVRCWGRNDHGQLGDGTTFPRSSPVEVRGLEHVKSVALGESFSCALDIDGAVHCWGANGAHQLVDGTSQDRSEPHMIPGLFDVLELGAGEAFGCAMLRDQTVRCWGQNTVGQAGDGTRDERPVPAVVRLPTK